MIATIDFANHTHFAYNTAMQLISNLYHYRQYIVHNAWHELRLRYAGSGLGALWNILLPLAQILIYALIFTRIMNLRGSLGRGTYAFVLYLCCGMFPWHAFSGTIVGGSQAFQKNARFLSSLSIPEEIFVAKSLVTELLVLQIYFVLLLIIGPILGLELSWTGLLMPLVGLLFLLSAFGLALLLASLRVFFQDLGHVLGVVMQMWMWLTPIIWVEAILPPEVRTMLRLNPALSYINAFRDLYLYGQIPSWTSWGMMVAWPIIFIAAGFVILQRLRPDIRDVI